MPLVPANLSTDFVFAKLHGRWTKAIFGETLAVLIRGGTVQAVGRTLAEAGIIVADRAEVQKRLAEKLIGEYDEIARLLPHDLADFYTALADRFFVENLKTVLHYRYFPKQSPDVRFLLIESPHLPQLDVRKLLEARSVHHFQTLLPKNWLTDELLPVLVELDDNHDLFVAEAQLDELYFRHLLQAAHHAPLKVRGLAQQFVKVEIDIGNIVLLLRNLTVYKLPPARIAHLMISGGNFPGQAPAEELASARDAQQLVALLPRQYRKIVEAVDRLPMYRIENGLWSYLYETVMRAFRDYNHPEKSAVAYPYLKRFEHLNLARLFEGLYLGLNASLLDTMMIGVHHV